MASGSPRPRWGDSPVAREEAEKLYYSAQGNRLLELGQAELAACKYRAGFQLVAYEETDDPQVHVANRAA